MSFPWWNPGLLHCKWIPYCWAPGDRSWSVVILDWEARASKLREGVLGESEIYWGVLLGELKVCCPLRGNCAFLAVYELQVTHQRLIPRAGLKGTCMPGKRPTFWNEIRYSKEPGPLLWTVPRNVPLPPFSPNHQSPENYFTFFSQERFYIFPFFPPYFVFLF